MKQLTKATALITLALASGWLAQANAAATASAPATAAPGQAQVQAVQQLMAAMQAEKMMRSTAGASRYANDAQRQAVMDKLSKVPPAEIYQRLAAPVARFVSTETALEMSKFYTSSYGQKVLQQTYNSGPSMYAAQAPTPVGPEKAQLKQPALVKARQEFAQAEAAIKHEAFVLLGAISKK